jgi:hypothetical protein
MFHILCLVLLLSFVSRAATIILIKAILDNNCIMSSTTDKITQSKTALRVDLTTSVRVPDKLWRKQKRWMCFVLPGVYYSLSHFIINYTNTTNAVDLVYCYSTHGNIPYYNTHNKRTICFHKWTLSRWKHTR